MKPAQATKVADNTLQFSQMARMENQSVIFPDGVDYLGPVCTSGDIVNRFKQQVLSDWNRNIRSYFIGGRSVYDLNHQKSFPDIEALSRFIKEHLLMALDEVEKDKALETMLPHLQQGALLHAAGIDIYQRYAKRMKLGSFPLPTFEFKLNLYPINDGIGIEECLTLSYIAIPRPVAAQRAQLTKTSDLELRDCQQDESVNCDVNHFSTLTWDKARQHSQVNLLHVQTAISRDAHQLMGLDELHVEDTSTDLIQQFTSGVNYLAGGLKAIAGYFSTETSENSLERYKAENLAIIQKLKGTVNDYVANLETLNKIASKNDFIAVDNHETLSGYDYKVQWRSKEIGARQQRLGELKDWLKQVIKDAKKASKKKLPKMERQEANETVTKAILHLRQLQKDYQGKVAILDKLKVYPKTKAKAERLLLALTAKLEKIDKRLDVLSDRHARMEGAAAEHKMRYQSYIQCLEQMQTHVASEGVALKELESRNKVAEHQLKMCGKADEVHRRVLDCCHQELDLRRTILDKYQVLLDELTAILKSVDSEEALAAYKETRDAIIKKVHDIQDASLARLTEERARVNSLLSDYAELDSSLVFSEDTANEIVRLQKEAERVDSERLDFVKLVTTKTAHQIEPFMVQHADKDFSELIVACRVVAKEALLTPLRQYRDGTDSYLGYATFGFLGSLGHNNIEKAKKLITLIENEDDVSAIVNLIDVNLRVFMSTDSNTHNKEGGYASALKKASGIAIREAEHFGLVVSKSRIATSMLTS